MAKQFIKLQISLFFKSNYSDQLEKASLLIKKEFGDGVVTQLGIPANMPPEIPRLIIKSSSVDINLAINRIDFFSTDSSFFEKFFPNILNVLSGLSVEIGRIGVVTTTFKEITIEELKNLFDKKVISTINPTQIVIRFNEVINLSGVNVNNSQMYESGFIKDEKNGSQKKGVIIMRDINTLLEDLSKNSFKDKVLTNFIRDAISKSEQILL